MFWALIPRAKLLASKAAIERLAARRRRIERL
jgi:hypothetical protein